MATMAKNLVLLAYGMTLGFPTILLPALQRGLEPALELTPEEISWLGSINLVCVPLGCLGSGLLTNKLGRKRAMMLVNAPLMVAWMILHLADSPAYLYCALALTGFTGGLLEAPVLTYVAEITTPTMRGFILGKMLPWRSVVLCNLVAPTCAFIALLFVPESPYWLASKMRLEDARRSLAWLRGWVKECAVEREFQELVATVQAPQSSPGETELDGTSSPGCWENLRRTLKPYRRATFVKPFLLVSGAFFFGHFSGMTTLQTYAVSIFESLGAPIDPYLATVILGLVELGGTLLCVIAVHWTGKRPLTLISTAGAAVCFGVVAGYAQLRESDLVPNASWLPLTLLIGSAFLTHMGIRLLPWILIGEVFPSEVRGMASGMASSVGYIFGFLANKTHFSLVGALTLPGTFWVYVVVSLVATLVLHLKMPETEGRTLLEINMHFAGRK
ncbi:hypothetical protein B566_EDAN017325 [Ephemera danica]|nr:hypothetical protein B566_EDAN017325 [Ephemera danica]